DGVPAEIRGEGIVGEREHLRLVASLDERDEGIARQLVREASAPGAKHAALAIEMHQRADGDWLGVVALLLDEAALARPEREGLVLQRTLAAAVAHGAIEGVVDQQELEDAVLGLADRRRLGGDDHARSDRRGGHRRSAAPAVD